MKHSIRKHFYRIDDRHNFIVLVFEWIFFGKVLYFQ